MNRIHLKFVLRTNRTNAQGTYPIYLYANINGEKKSFTLKRFIPLNAWNEKRQEVRMSHPDWNLINDDMSRYRAKAEEMRIAADKEEEKISIHQFERTFRGGVKDVIDIFTYIEEDIRQFGNTYAYATIKMYESQSRKLKKFSDKLKFTEITPLFWKQYDSYLITLKNNENTRWKAYRTLKIFMNKAIQNGVIKADPLIGVNVKKPDGNQLSLTIDELRKLETIYTGVLTKQQKKVLRYFLFSCFTAMRYSDVKNLVHSNIFLGTHNPYIRFVQQKTSSPLIIPIGKKALRYLPVAGLPNESVFKVYSNQITNKVLKDIMKLAEINKSISFHCSRHTYASIALELSGDIALVGNMCGHKKISLTKIYAKIGENAKTNLRTLMDAI